MKKTVFVCFWTSLTFQFNYNFVHSQTLRREVLGSTGGTFVGDGFNLKSTIGQPSNTVRFSGENASLRQGFQQPVDVKGNINECDACRVKVHPNPMETQAEFSIPLITNTYDFQVLDLNGRLILERIAQSQELQFITNQLISSGQYIVRITYQGGCFCSQKLIVK